MGYMQFDEPMRPPMNLITAKNSFAAGQKHREREVAELKELLRLSANLFLYGQKSVEPIDSEDKQKAMAEAGRILEAINGKLLSR